MGRGVGGWVDKTVHEGMDGWTVAEQVDRWWGGGWLGERVSEAVGVDGHHQVGRCVDGMKGG